MGYFMKKKFIIFSFFFSSLFLTATPVLAEDTVSANMEQLLEQETFENETSSPPETDTSPEDETLAVSDESDASKCNLISDEAGASNDVTVQAETDISDDTEVTEDTALSDDTEVSVDAELSDDTKIAEDTELSDNTEVTEDTELSVDDSSTNPEVMDIEDSVCNEEAKATEDSETVNCSTTDNYDMDLTDALAADAYETLCQEELVSASSHQGEYLGSANGIAIYRYDILTAGGYLTIGSDGNIRYVFADGTTAVNCYLSNGVSSFYVGGDGLPYHDQHSYYPDNHMIYFDGNTRQVFNSFCYCEDLGFTAYLDYNGFAYQDQITYSNNQPYYLNADGKLEQNGWFHFANGSDIGYANADGTLMNSCFSQDTQGRLVYFQADGTLARGLIFDGVWYYDMDETDGHCKGQFKKPYKYFAIGNSLTVHPVIADLWWGSWGMAASSADKDYVGRVTSSLSSTYEVAMNRIYYTSWECSADRNSQLSTLDSYLTSDLDLVTIQLGDNITGGFETLVSDYRNLINRVRERAPGARIMVIDEFCWPNAAIQSAQRQACSELGITYIDLSAINQGGYTAGIGTVVSGDDGTAHVISNGAVAAHPGDSAMEYIANQILWNLLYT